jgi:hypothetical protein
MIARSKDGREVRIRRVTDYPWYEQMTPQEIKAAQEKIEMDRARCVREVEHGREVGVPDEEMEAYLEWLDADN